MMAHLLDSSAGWNRRMKLFLKNSPPTMTGPLYPVCLGYWKRPTTISPPASLWTRSGHLYAATSTGNCFMCSERWEKEESGVSRTYANDIGIVEGAP